MFKNNFSLKIANQVFFFITLREKQVNLPKYDLNMYTNLTKKKKTKSIQVFIKKYLNYNELRGSIFKYDVFESRNL